MYGFGDSFIQRGPLLSRKKRDNNMKLIGFCIATVGVFSFFTGNFIFGAILFFVGTGMMPDY